MNPDGPQEPPSPTLDVVAEIDAACDRFEAEWRAGRRPRIQDYLPAPGEPGYPRFLEELLRLDLEYRAEAGERVTLQDYLLRFPEHGALIRQVFSTASFSTGPGGTSSRGTVHRGLAPETQVDSQRPGLPDPCDDPGVGSTVTAAGSLPAVPGYEILGVLGRGGMGVVYKARHLKLKRLVALKMILAGSHAGPEEIARFRLEAEAVGRLQHQNIVQIFEVSEHDGFAYLSLEYCEGGSLAKGLDGTPRPPRLAAHLVEKLATAMHAAHQRGIVHRDLKPGNVLLTADGQPKIADFGLAKDMDDSAGQTASGAILGTPSYMAPEQAGGRSKQITPAVDVYALGAMLYELLTGRPPFRGLTPLDTMMQVLSVEPVPPSRLQPKIPRDLEALCLKCLAKDPRKRYRTTARLAADLQRFSRGLPLEARPTSRPERLGHWCRRNPLVAGLSAAVVVLLAVAVVAFWLYRDAAGLLAKYQQWPGEGTDRRGWVAHDGQVACVACSPDGRRVLSGGWDRSVRLWDPEDGQLLLRLTGHNDIVWTLAFSPDGRRGISGSQDRTLRLWDLKTGQELHRLDGHGGVISSVAFLPDGRHVISGAWDSTARLWDLETAKEVGRFNTGAPVLSLALTRDGRHVLFGSNDGKLRYWDVRTRTEVRTFAGPADYVEGVALTGDGRRAVASGADGLVHVYDVASGRERKPLRGHTAKVDCVVLSPDGSRVLSCGEDKTIRLWELVGERELSRCYGAAGIRWATFSPDGRHAASACYDGSVGWWALPR
jgi:tRNA A-37 threonylcarbamoyl transferase component Bud32